MALQPDIRLIKSIARRGPTPLTAAYRVLFYNRYINKPVQVYNFTVDKTHNYFAGNMGAWVHNCTTINIPTHGRKYNQLSKRGWSRESINTLVNNPYTTRRSVNKATGNSATAYYKKDGHYVVRDDVTGDLVQMSDTTRASSEWIPDDTIVNPYIP